MNFFQIFDFQISKKMSIFFEKNGPSGNSRENKKSEEKWKKNPKIKFGKKHFFGKIWKPKNKKSEKNEKNSDLQKTARIEKLKFSKKS